MIYILVGKSGYYSITTTIVDVSLLPRIYYKGYGDALYQNVVSELA